MGEYEFSFNKLSSQLSLNFKEMSACRTITNNSTNYNNLDKYSCYSNNKLSNKSSKSLDDNKTIIIDAIKMWWKEKYPPFTRTCVSERYIKNVLFGYIVGSSIHR